MKTEFEMNDFGRKMVHWRVEMYQIEDEWEKGEDVLLVEKNYHQILDEWEKEEDCPQSDWSIHQMLDGWEKEEDDPLMC